MYNKHTFEERLTPIERFLSGEPAQRIAKELGLSNVKIQIYTTLYEAFGEDGFRRRPNIRPAFALKLQVVQDYQEHCLSLSAAAVGNSNNLKKQQQNEKTS